MPGEITAVSGAIKSVSDLVDGILTRSDRDAPDKDREDNIITLQNAYAKNDLDSDNFRLFIDKLCNKAGNPLTPTGDVGTGRRELLHALLLNTIALIHERQLTARLLAKINK